MDPWTEVEADRTALADHLRGLTAEQWAQPSLCEGWSVHDVAAHLLVVPTNSNGSIFKAFVGSGFNLDRFSDKMIARVEETTPAADVPDALHAAAASRNVPIGMKPMHVMSEVLVHSGDITRALGTGFELPVEHYATALEFLKDQQTGLGCKKRVAGLTISATDDDWSTGQGPLVEGRAADLIMAITGRDQAFDALTGDGVEMMRSR